MIDLETIVCFRENKASLRETSKDDSKGDIQYMTESQCQAVNFDLVKRRYVNQLGYSEDKAKSIDALAQTEDTIFFIQFKNGKVEKNDVKTKVRDSLLMYCDITKTTISDTRVNSVFILVYNPEIQSHPNQMPKYNEPPIRESQISIAKHFLQKAEQEWIGFDLERFKGLYFRDVHTYTIEEFDRFLRKIYS